jgi:HK97 family phage portal protein
MGLFRGKRTTLAESYERGMEDRSLRRSQQLWPSYPAYPAYTDIGPNDAMRIGDAFACVRLRADTAASLPLVAYRRLADGDRERFSGRLADLIAQPSPGNVTANLIGTCAAHLATWGNCYVGKYRGPDGAVVQLAPLNPAGMLVELVAGNPRYTFADQNGVQELGTADVVHLKALSTDGIVGLSPVAQARQALELSTSLEQHAAGFAKNGGRPGGVLRIPGWRSAQGTAPADVQGDWESKFVGEGNSGKLLIVTGEEAVQYQGFSLSMADAEFVAQRNLSTQEICRIFKVPPHLIGAATGERLTYANAETASLDFLKFDLGPDLVLIEQTFSADADLSPQSVFVEFLVDALLRSDSLTRATVYEKALAGGWMTVDEVRQRENLPVMPKTGGPALPANQPTLPAPPGIAAPMPFDPGTTGAM